MQGGIDQQGQQGGFGIQNDPLKDPMQPSGGVGGIGGGGYDASGAQQGYGYDDEMRRQQADADMYGRQQDPMMQQGQGHHHQQKGVKDKIKDGVQGGVQKVEGLFGKNKNNDIDQQQQY